VKLTDKQKGVVRGVIPAAVLSVVGLCGAALVLPVSTLPADESGARIAWAVRWSLLPILTLMVAVARVGNHRFYTPEDIDGSGLTSGTPQVQVLRAVLQNTLEQTVLAVAAYTIWAVVMPRRWLWSIAIAALFFVTGRIFFAYGYTRGAPGRALGFGLTAYPTFGMLAVVAVVSLFRLVMK
jgi:MAPEG family